MYLHIYLAGYPAGTTRIGITSYMYADVFPAWRAMYELCTLQCVHINRNTFPA